MPSEWYQLTKTTKKGDLRLNSSKIMYGVLEIVTLKKTIFLWWCPMDECEATGKKKAKSKDSDGMPSAITDAKA